MRVISISENAVAYLAKAKGVRFVAPDRETFGMAYTLLSADTTTNESPAHGTANVPDAASNNVASTATASASRSSTPASAITWT